MAKILVLHGPNLNLLGTREPDIYGNATLVDINSQLVNQAEKLNHTIECLQSNNEAVLIDKIQDNAGDAFIIFNPAAFTHTSVALRDALLATGSQFIEVHLSNPHAREDFRKTSYFSDIAKAVICGCGAKGYEFALQRAHGLLTQS